LSDKLVHEGFLVFLYPQIMVKSWNKLRHGNLDFFFQNG
jgi:hypothetical protein